MSAPLQHCQSQARQRPAMAIISELPSPNNQTLGRSYVLDPINHLHKAAPVTSWEQP